MAGDEQPLEILLQLLLLCEDKNVPYVFALSKVSLVGACGVPSAVIACFIQLHDGSPIFAQVINLRGYIERLLITADCFFSAMSAFSLAAPSAVVSRSSRPHPRGSWCCRPQAVSK